MDLVIKFTIEGEPASKANSRRLVMLGGKPRVIKSQKALNYLSGFAIQCPVLAELIESDVLVDIDIYYASKRPDLDESVILDAMQERIYKNDRQVVEKRVRKYIDRDRPRSEISVYSLEGRVIETDGGHGRKTKRAKTKSPALVSE